jgi:hypothetical protein
MVGAPGGRLGAAMSDKFIAQTLVETRSADNGRRLEMTFVDAAARRQTLSLPVGVAADLAPVLKSLVAGLNGSGRTQFTRTPKMLAVASAEHERLVLIRFDDEPPYGLELENAENLWRGLREEAASISRLKAPSRQ